MSDELPPLDPELRALLDAERRADLGIAPSAVERTLTRLAATGGGGPGEPSSSAPTPRTSTKGTSWTHARVASLTLGAFALGAVGGFAVHDAFSEPTPTVAAPALRADPPDAATHPELTRAALDAPVVAIAEAPSTPSHARPSATVHDDEVPDDAVPDDTVAEDDASSTAAERALIDRARVALSRGDAHEALVALLGHERRFPEGELREERDILVIRALVRSSRPDAATARIARYHREHPEGRYADEVDELERALGGP